MFSTTYLPNIIEITALTQNSLDGSPLRGLGTQEWKRLHLTSSFVLMDTQYDACDYRLHLSGIHDNFTVSESGLLHELGCLMQIEGSSGECHFEIPMSLAERNSRREVGIVITTTQDSCRWPPTDSFATVLAPHTALYECPDDQFWSQTRQECVLCVDTPTQVCPPGTAVMGCAALQGHAAQCESCLNDPLLTELRDFTWSTGTCNFTCNAGFFKNITDTAESCQMCTQDLVEVCKQTAGMRWVSCSDTQNERCVPCAPVDKGVYSANEEFVAGSNECHSECKADHYRRPDDTSTLAIGTFPAHCFNYATDGDETGMDSGGSCTSPRVNLPCIEECEAEEDVFSDSTYWNTCGGISFYQNSGGYNIDWNAKCTEYECQRCPCLCAGINPSGFQHQIDFITYEIKTACMPRQMCGDNRPPCVPCTSLALLQERLAVGLRALDTFYRFDACTDTADASMLVCDVPLGARLTADATNFSAPCSFECLTGFQLIDGHCVDCVLPRDAYNNTLPELAYMLDRHCNVTCNEVEGYYWRNETCINCNASVCHMGTYLANNCNDCLPCERRLAINGIFTSRGEFNVSTSCQEECTAGFFQEAGTCVSHSVPTCANNEYLLTGTPLFDAECVLCSSCEGLEEKSPCSANANADCQPCPTASNVLYSHTNCTAACAMGFVNNTRTGECEVCSHECAVGFEAPTTRANCTHCEPCPTKRANATFTQGCLWQCLEGYAYVAELNACEREQATRPIITRRPLKASCPRGQQLSDDYECKACDVQTPDVAGEDVSWTWNAYGPSCQWQCKSGFFLYRHFSGSTLHAPRCLTWAQYDNAVASKQRTTSLASASFTASNTINEVEPTGRVRFAWQTVAIAGGIVAFALVIFCFTFNGQSDEK